MSIDLLRAEFLNILGLNQKITVLSHINPDPDAIGTSLGIYTWLKEQGKQVEIVNASREIPRNLDFLPNYSKIKYKMDYTDSLIIACDCGNLDRLGFDLENREIVNIDHHVSNTKFGKLNVVDTNAVSSSELAYNLISPIKDISKESAISFYAGLISDTRNFTTANMHKNVFLLASKLVEYGIDVAMVTRKMLHRRSLASLRILGFALESMRLECDARVAVVKIYQDDMLKTGAKFSDLDGIVDYAKSLATVEIALVFIEKKDEVKVSIRSKSIDISSLTIHFGGGGHSQAGGFESKDLDIHDLHSKVMNEIVKRSLL